MAISLNDHETRIKKLESSSGSSTGIPDYTTLKTTKVPFTAPYNCVAFVDGLTGRSWHWTKVNSVEFFQIYEDYNGYCNITIPLKKGDVLTGSSEFRVRYAQIK